MAEYATLKTQDFDNVAAGYIAPRRRNIETLDRRQIFCLFGLVATVFFIAPGTAIAADLHDATGSFKDLLGLIQNSASYWDGKLRDYAITLFWSLAVIQLIWTFLPLVFKQADFGEIVGELVRFVLVTGFFFALLKFSTSWGQAIINSFREAGGNASGFGKTIFPGDMFGIAVELGDTILHVHTLNPLTAVFVTLSGVIVVLCFGFIAAFMALTLIESYIVINASVLFMGFGGSQWTREYALAITRYAIAVGAKLFILTLIVGLIMSSVNDWKASFHNDNADMLTMVGLGLACAYLSKTIPELVAGMITGSSPTGGHALGFMAAAISAGVASGISAAATNGIFGKSGTGIGSNGSGSDGLADMISSSLMGGSSSTGSNMRENINAYGNSGDSNSRSPINNTLPPQRTGGGQTGKPTTLGTPPTGGQSQGDNKSPVSPLTQFADSAVKSTGIMAAISVPGMEPAMNLSLNVPPPDYGEGENKNQDMAPNKNMGAGDSNIIRAGETTVPSNTPPQQNQSDKQTKPDL